MEATASAGKLLRAPGLKRGKTDELPADRVKLERVLGLTVACNAALDCDPQTELLAYPAGCTVVLLDARRGRQSHLLNASRKTVSCLSFSADGRYLATGEVGHLPAVRVWDLQEPRTQLAELLGHKFGVVCVAFSPSGKHLVSVGSQHDMIVNVWDWRQGVKLASNKVSARIKAVSFAENGSYFVTVGNRHVKFWYLEHARSAKYKEPVPLMGRSAILGEQRNNHFCDVGCGRGEKGDSTYAVTRSGLLCEFNNRRLLDKWVELRTTSANCMVVGDNYIFIGCAEGIVRCFSPSTLQFITTLPRTHYLGVDVAQGLTISHMGANSGNAHYPDVVALAYDSTTNKLSCVYNDHSLYIWDVEDIKRVGKAHSFLHHSACIWGVETYPENGAERLLPPGSFVTCSSDDTVRVWNLDHLESTTGSTYQRNIYSSELLKVLYIDPELTHLKDQADSKVEGSYDGRNGVRSIRISPDGKHLASGDRSGNVRVHELERLAELCRIEAHDAEVLCLEFSPAGSSLRLLASASRDRLIHVFNVDQGYDFMQTLDDHSSSITAVRFLNGNAHDQLQMVSCGADKSIIFRQLQACEFARGHNVAGKSTLYDMEVDHGQKHILTACQDRNVRVYSAASGKHSKTFRGSVGEEGSLIKVVLDSSGIYAATSCTDKTLCIYDYYSNELMATMFGHSELVTGLRFTNDCRRLISASGDGCIFVWRLPRDMVVTMQARLAQQAARAGRRIPTHNGHLDNEFASLGSDLGDRNANVEEDCRLSAAELPLWATKQTERGQTDTRPTAVELPRGRWAQRIGPSAGISVKSVYDEETIIPFPHQDKRLDSDGGGSKDSSIDSGTETLRQYPDARPGTRPKYKYDGDDESFSDERDHVMYYPANDETGSEFTVNAMDVEELRRSQRRMKNKRADRLMPEMPHITISTSVSGSQDSEEDEEDEASTPGANEPAELSSALSVSTESLEQFRRREKYLVSAFQSLPNAEPATKDAGGSISARHSARNSAVISAARMTRGEGEAESKRDELRKRIEHTRRQLSSVGFRSTLKNSQSICDLSRHDRTNNSSHAAGRYTQMGGKLYANVIRHKLANPSLSQLCDRGYATNPMLQTYRPLSYQHSKPLATGLFAAHNRNALFENCANFYRDSNVQDSAAGPNDPGRDDDNRNCSGGTNVAEQEPNKNSTNFYRDTNSRCADLFQNRVSSSGFTSPERASFSSNNLSSNDSSVLACNNNPKFMETVRFSVCQVVTERISDKFYQLAKTASNSSFREDRFVDCSTENKQLDVIAPPLSNHFKSVKPTDSSASRAEPIASEIKRGDTACRPGYLNLSAKKRNQSLPQSPVTEESSLLSPTSGNQTDNESSAFRRRIGGSLRSCSYFLDLNKLCDKKPGHYTSAKSSESLPTSLPASLPASMPASKAVSRDDLDEDHFSSDSLEEPSEFSNRTPKRSIPNQDSRFQQFCKANQEFQSQESIVSNTSNQLSSTGDLLELCEQDRHSSASFFLSLRRYDNRSQESILSNDFLDDKSIPSQHRSTEDILDREFEMGISESRSSEDILNERFMKKSTSLPRGYFLPETSSLPRRPKTLDQSIDSLDSIEHRPIIRTTSLQDAKKVSDAVAKPKVNALSRKGSCPVGRPRQTADDGPPTMTRSKSLHGTKPPIAAKPQGRVTHKPPVKPVKPRRKSLVGGTQVGRVARLREAFSCPEGGKTDSDEDKKASGAKTPVSDGKACMDTSGHPEMVKFLCRSFERALEREMSDSDGFRTAGSNSSTPLTSSSGANSPKRDSRRLWPPASRAVVNARSRADHGDSDEEAEVSGGLRRACSLSDLVSPAPRRNPLQVSGKLKPGGKRYKSSGMSRSTSMLVLNQSDSDGEGGGGGRTVRVNGLMRPTISSLNKMAPGRRGRGLSGAYSTVNLSSVGQPEDSSSEESAKPRPRSSSIDRAAPTPAQRNRAAIRTPTSRARAGHEEPGLDVTQAPLNAQLCNSVATQLKYTADSVAQLCRRLAADQQSDSTAMLRNLKRAISDAQNTLKTVNADAATPDVASVMQQYSEMLLDMVQQNMSKPEAS